MRTQLQLNSMLAWCNGLIGIRKVRVYCLKIASREFCKDQNRHRSAPWIAAIGDTVVANRHLPRRLGAKILNDI
jgi:hypothetical protein